MPVKFSNFSRSTVSKPVHDHILTWGEEKKGQSEGQEKSYPVTVYPKFKARKIKCQEAEAELMDLQGLGYMPHIGSYKNSV